MEQDNIEIKSEVKHKTGKGVKAALVALGLLTIISTSGLVYLMFSSNSQKNQLESQVKSAKEELAKANETVSKYEAATGTKAVEEKIENTTVKEIVRPMAIDTKIGDLVNMIDRERRGKMKGENEERMPIIDNWPIITFKEIFTNKEATYLIANMYISVNYMVITNKEKGSTRVEGGGGDGNAVYYRALPNGDWKEAYAGNGIPGCETLSEETKRVFKDLRIKDGKSMLSCSDQNVKENFGIVEI